MQRKRLIFIDMDGTIIHGDYSGAFLCRLNGVDRRILRETEEMELEGLVNWLGGDMLRARHMKGLKLSVMQEQLYRLNIIGGLEEFLSAVRGMGFTPVLASAGPSPVAEALAGRFGFEAWFASDYEVRDGEMTGEVSHFLSAPEKAARALQICLEQGVSPAICAAVGDGESDIDLFGVVGCPIALNAKKAVERHAVHAFLTEKITDLLPVLEEFTKQMV